MALLQGFGLNLQSGARNSGRSIARPIGNQDDVALADAVVASGLSRAAAIGRRIDLSSIHAVGFSNGEMPCYRLAAERSATFASVAAMSASIGGDPDPGDPSSAVHVNDPALYGADPVSILHVHGLADTHAPFSGGPMDRPGRTRSDVPVVDELAMRAGHDGCDAVPRVEAHPGGVLRKRSGGRRAPRSHSSRCRASPSTSRLRGFTAPP